ncbi:hypothetical protein [Pseudotabrizicola sp. 4114]|uniref:hypothetical protein n=1 Tax=Pseudotabrizicola sp. 4114 TaxID=2817731 RepID=UPI002866D72A|nr:hypothetical protein [Pseudorhodobacter sp. 4114]
MENDINAGLARPGTQRNDAERPASERPKEYFSVRLTLSGAAQEFEGPRQAGEAFFRADPAERPSVAHIDGNTARTMARTEIHGAHETGETRYFKSLPDSHAPDAEFRAGFLNAMEASLTERLGKVEWGKDGPAVTERLDTGLREDLEAFARRAPEKAATLWADHSDAVPPGPTLRAAVQAREDVADRDVTAYKDAIAEKPPVIATGDWVTTDANVELRPVAVATDRGIHTGYEANLPGGENELTVSERTFPNSREALRHAYDFYEGGEEGLELSVKRAVEMDRALVEEPDRSPEGLVLEHLPQPKFARPETAIYAGDNALLVLTLGKDNEVTRDLAERLVADPGFRKVVAEHIPDAESTLGTGRFVDGEGSGGFLPDELLAVTSYGRDGGAEVLAKFPDEGPLSEALAKHLAQSSVLAAYAEAERQRSDFASDPARAISVWVAQSTARIDRLPSDRQDDLRSEMRSIANEAAAAFGLDRGQAEIGAPPRSTLYSTAISANTLMIAGAEKDLDESSAKMLSATLSLHAHFAGIDFKKLETRLETGAADAREEEAWVKSDIADVAKRHGFDLGSAQGRSSAPERVDRFYERAAELIQSARSNELTRGPDPLVEALGSLARVHASQGSVAFRNENQARDFAEEMKERYGASVLKDIAAGRTEALAKDVPDPTARAAVAMAVVSAAKEHPSLGRSTHEAEAAERRMVAQAASRPPEHARAHAHDRNRDREF